MARAAKGMNRDIPHDLRCAVSAQPDNRRAAARATVMCATLVCCLAMPGFSAAAGPAQLTENPRAALVSKAETQAVKATLQRQFDAFARDDAPAAFALASAGIRSRFGTAEKFMAVVREQYQPVYRHRIALFTDTERVDDAVLQTVRLTDADDKVWVAVYQLVREADGQWHIVGCQLLETSSVST